MPILLSSIRLAFAAALATHPTLAFNQAAPLDYVPDRPYTAQVVEMDVQNGASGARVRHETKVFEARDSQGRTWIESFQSNNLDHPMMANLYLPLRRQFIQLFPGQKSARVMTFPGAGPIPIHRNLHVVKIKTETLPGQAIHGIDAVGTRTTQVMRRDDGQGKNVGDVQET